MELKKSQNRDILYKTHNKLYTESVLSEIWEENKSEISDSLPKSKKQFKTQNNLPIFLPEEIKAQNKSNKGERGFAKESTLEYNIEVVQTIVASLVSYLGLNVTFEIDQDSLSLMFSLNKSSPRNNWLIKSQDEKLKLRVILKINKDGRRIAKRINKLEKKNNTMLNN